METFRLFHLSDLHFSAKEIGWRNEIVSVGSFFSRWTLSKLFSGKIFYPSTFDKDVALAAAEYIYRERNNVDALVITGDLATTGDDQDLTVARNFLLGDVPPSWKGGGFLRSYPILGSGLNTVIMPGNHDRYRTTRRAWLHPGGQGFEVVFDRDWSLLSEQPGLKVHGVGGGGRALSDPDSVRFFQFTKGTERLLIFCADFTLRAPHDSCYQSNFGYMGQGRVYLDTVGLLKDLTMVARMCTRPKNAVIWLIHFPPEDTDQQCATCNNLSLLDSEYLIEAAAECQVDLFLAGHIHKQRQFTVQCRGDPIRVLCAGTACSVDENGDGNRFGRLEFDVCEGRVGRLSLQDIAYNDQDGCFRATGCMSAI